MQLPAPYRGIRGGAVASDASLFTLALTLDGVTGADTNRSRSSGEDMKGPVRAAERFRDAARSLCLCRSVVCRVCDGRSRFETRAGRWRLPAATTPERLCLRSTKPTPFGTLPAPEAPSALFLCSRLFSTGASTTTSVTRESTRHA